MNADQIFECCLEINNNVLKELTNTYNEELSNKETRLLIPSYRNNLKRLSEQELRFAFATYLERKFDKLNLFYTVETPTEKLYSNTKKNSRSALSDLSLYDINRKKICNIEFKAHNPKPEDIEKDIKKMCKENIPYAWIHIFEKEKSNTVKTLFTKFINIFKKIKKVDLPEEPLFFYILILKTKIILSRKILDSKELEQPDNIFNLEYSEYKEQKQNITIKQWHIIKI